MLGPLYVGGGGGYLRNSGWGWEWGEFEPAPKAPQEILFQFLHFGPVGRWFGCVPNSPPPPLGGWDLFVSRGCSKNLSGRVSEFSPRPPAPSPNWTSTPWPVPWRLQARGL